MKPFLDRVAHALLEQHGSALDRVAVVLPSRRAGLYLRKYLAQAAGRTLWSPDLLDMGAFMERFTGLRQGHAIELLFSLYEAHRAVAGERAEPMAEFLHWAPTTLRDMSEVDAHLLDLDALYRDLRSFHEIEEWSFRLGTLSPAQDRMLQQWRYTGELHRTFTLRMEAEGVGTSGWVSRQAAAGAKAGRPMPWDAVWFAGLNALDIATTTVVQQLQEQGKAYVAWDADRFYLDDRKQEAGHFLRRSIRDLGEGVLPPVDLIRTLPRTVGQVTVPNRVGQAAFAAQLVAEWEPEHLVDTAIVLADEDLLMPLLEALSPEIGPVNVTMGMPLAALPVHGLTEAFLDLHANATVQGFHHGDTERLLLHPFLHEGSATEQAVASLKNTQRFRSSGELLAEIVQEARLSGGRDMAAAFRPVDPGTPQDIADRITALIGLAQRICRNDPFATEQLYHMAKLQRRLDSALRRAGAEAIDLRTYTTLRARLLREERIGFYGEPLKGVQVMGFLEARAIDHERVVVLGANEGTLPRTGGQQSWIPFEVRRAYRLPVGSDSEAITAYHFDRMAQHAGEVHLVHDPGDQGAGEPSRYIARWAHEVIGRTATTGTTRTVAATFPVRRTPLIAVPKDATVLSRIAELLRKGLSPSALGTWLTCPLDFHFRYVLNIRPPEEVDPKLGSDVLGEAVHGVLEDIYTTTLSTPLAPDLLLAHAARTQQALEARLGERFPATALTQGHFRLRIGMAAQAIAEHLRAEAVRITTSITTTLAVEEQVTGVLPNGARLKGRCDRIELRDGVPYILDVKTGAVDARQLVLKDLDRAAIGADQRYALQLLVYAWCYLEQHPEVPRVRAVIVPLQRASASDGLPLKVMDGLDITRDMLPAITTLFTTLVDELRDPGVPFTHDPEARFCACCAELA